MSSQTPNLNLVLPVGTEHVSRQIINDNNTKIDTAVGSNSTAISKFQGVEIAENTNINSLTTPGNYYSATGGRSATLLNAPTTSTGFTLSVAKRGSNIDQTAQFCGDTYVRGTTSDGATWTAWQKLALCLSVSVASETSWLVTITKAMKKLITDYGSIIPLNSCTPVGIQTTGTYAGNFCGTITVSSTAVRFLIGANESVFTGTYVISSETMQQMYKMNYTSM